MNTETLYRKAKEQRYSIAALERAADLGNGTIGKWRDGNIEPMSKSINLRWTFYWLRKPPAMPVEVPRKKALASSIERSELGITIQQIRMHSTKTTNARLRAAEHLMQAKNHSVHL